MRLTLLILCLLAGPVSAEPLRVLAIGDSVLAWHWWTGRDIPSILGDALGAEVDNGAISGARFSGGYAGDDTSKSDVRAQYRSGPWDVVLMNGGANDFLNECNCGACDAVLDGLISPNLTGEVPDLIAKARSSGAQVLWMGYYATPWEGPFAGCRPYFVEYDKRVAQLAAQTPGLVFADSEDAVDGNDRSFFAFDGIHPSPKGARSIGTYLAQFVAQ